MGSIISLVANLIKPIADLFDDFTFTEEERSTAKMKLAQLESEKQREAFSLELARIEAEREKEKLSMELKISKEKAASLEIEMDRKVELELARVALAATNSASKYVSYARPSIIYCGLLIMILQTLGNFILGFFGKTMTLEIPTALAYAWSAISGGYVVARSVEKLKGRRK